MAYIYPFIGGEQTLVLNSDDEFVRSFQFGMNWNKLRIAMRCAINAPLSNTNALFQVGLCAGTANTWKSANTTDYIGVNTVGGGSYPSEATWTFNVSQFFDLPANQTSLKRVGNTTNSTFSAGGAGRMSAVSQNIRGGFIVDWVRGSPSTPYKWTLYYSNSPTTDMDITNFLLSAGLETFPYWNWNTNSGTAATYSPQADDLDTLSLYWQSNTGAQLWISDISIVRFF